jgi:hypothetical protein
MARVNAATEQARAGLREAEAASVKQRVDVLRARIAGLRSRMTDASPKTDCEEQQLDNLSAHTGTQPVQTFDYCC